MPQNPLLLTLTALALGLASGAQAQELTEADLAACQAALAGLGPNATPNPEQERCLALLAQLGVQPAQGQPGPSGPSGDTDDNNSGNLS